MSLQNDIDPHDGIRWWFQILYGVTQAQSRVKLHCPHFFSSAPMCNPELPSCSTLSSCLETTVCSSVLLGFSGGFRHKKTEEMEISLLHWEGDTAFAREGEGTPKAEGLKGKGFHRFQRTREDTDMHMRGCLPQVGEDWVVRPGANAWFLFPSPSPQAECDQITSVGAASLAPGMCSDGRQQERERRKIPIPPHPSRSWNRYKSHCLMGYWVSRSIFLQTVTQLKKGK